MLVNNPWIFLTERVLHLDEEVVVLDLCLGNHLLRSLSLLHQGHICLQIALLLHVFLLLLALVALGLHVGLLVLLPEIDFISELLVRILYLAQVIMNLPDQTLHFLLSLCR